jgi:protein TonB
MSPAALALAVGLHVLVAASLWWAAPSRRLDHAETPIMISIDPQPLSAGNTVASAPGATEVLPAEPGQEQAAPAEPAAVDARLIPEPPRPAAVPPAIAPAVPTPAEPAPPRPSAEPAPVQAPAPTPAPAPAETASVAAEPAPEAETEAAWQTDASSWKPQVTLERSLTTPPPRPAPRPSTVPRTAQTPGQRLEDYPPQTSSLGGPSSGSYDQAMGDGGARNDYLSRVYRHIDPYRDYPAAARAGRQHGRVVTRVTINRAGELLDIRLDRSSGWPLIDNAEMAAIRRAMPLPPVPAGMRGDPIVLVLPMTY